MKRRLRQLNIAGDLLLHHYTFGFQPPYFVTRAIPDGAKIIEAYVVPGLDETVVRFIVEHESFEPVELGVAELPIQEIAFEPVEFSMKEEEEPNAGTI